LNKRKYSSTPIVHVTVDDKGREEEEIVCICPQKKDNGDAMALRIIKLLNNDVNNKVNLDITNISLNLTQ